MKLSFFILFLFGGFYFSKSVASFKTTPSTLNIDTIAIINKIKLDFKKINANQKHYKKKNRDIFGLSAEGGEAISYYNGVELKKIQCVLFGEMGKAETDYYFNNNQLFFVYKKSYLYDKPMNIKNFKIKKMEENRYYINDKSIIKWLIGNRANMNLKILKSEYLTIYSELEEIKKNF